MKIPRRLPMFVVAAALLGLIALLATLQYRWLGQVSAAERERMQANLAARATGFATEFDREIARAYLTFQLDPLENDDNVAAHVNARMDRWQATSRYPRLIKDVYIASRGEGREPAVQRFNTATRFLEPVAWPSALEGIRQTIVAPPMPQPGATVVVRTMPATVWESIPALVVSAPLLFFSSNRLTMFGAAADVKAKPPSVSFVILRLDRDYITNEMLPAIARQHFRGAGDAIEYELAVVNTGTKGTLYSTRPTFTPDPTAPSDAAADLLQVRLQDFSELASEVRRFSSFISTRVARPGDARSVEGGIAIRDAPGSLLLQHGATEKRTIEATLANTVRAAASRGHWRLVVKHPSGSLETAVAQVRRRNLLISSGILAVLGASVGFLVLTTRRAQELARQQMEFVAAVSHELRTPLAVIRSAADNLAEGIVTEDPQVRKYGDLVRGEGRRLSEMVEQILELAGIHSGQRGFALAPVAVLPLLRDVVAASATLIEEAGVRVEDDVPEAVPPVLADETALRRVFQNLLMNAVKYGASGGWVGLKARANGREVLITVADRGAGIDPAEQARIFEPFYRAPAAVAARVQGAGLGLNLVQRIAEAHGGRITLRSAPGEGSEFTVHLPAASEEPAARTTRVPDPANTSA